MLAAYVGRRPGYARAAVVKMNGFWGNWVGDTFSETFADLGGTISGDYTVNSTAEYTGTLSAAMTGNPQVIHFANDNGNTAGLLSAVARNLGMTDVIIAWTTFVEDRGVLDAYANTAGAAAEGDIATMYQRAPEDMPGYEALNADYIAAGFAHHGEEAGLLGAFGYDAARILIAAIDRADSVDPAGIRDEIAGTRNYQGVVGTYEGFDSKGDVIPQWAWMERYQAGRWVVISPHEVYLPIAAKDY
jgi:branched-chain amino acid transport system substrate-binding protein